MNKKILPLMCLLLLTSCFKKGQEFTLLVTKQTHSVNLHIDKEKNIFEISSNFVEGDIMTLQKNPNDEKVLQGEKDQSNNYWKFADGKSGHIQEVIVAPYYGMFSYNVLQKVQSTGMAIMHPMCPVTTKYLFLAIMNNGFPIIGCIDNTKSVDVD